MKIGYARENRRNQSLNTQLYALQKANCKRIYEETLSATNKDSPVLANILRNIRKTDTLVVYTLDCLGYSLNNLVKIISQLIEKQVDFISLEETIDTTTPEEGRVTHKIFAALTKFYQKIVRERTHIGLSTARLRGRIGGKPPGLTKKAELIACAAETLYLERKLSVQQIAKQLGICKATLYAYLKHRKVKISGYTYKAP
jgi:DNA invertase Pin-like site-specific DNA recombinase